MRSALGIAGVMAACAPYGPSRDPAVHELMSLERSVAQLSAAGDATCALLMDGSVRCWGSASSTEPFASIAPKDVRGLEPATRIAVDHERACALTREKTVWCWQLFDATPPVEAPGISDAVELALASHTACARLDNGEVTCWSDSGRHTMTRGALQLVAAGGRYAARLVDGRVLAWDAGRLESTADELQVDSVEHLYSTRHAVCARLWDGGLWCSGLFKGHVPVQLEQPATEDAVESAGDCVLTHRGTVCCGFCDDPAVDRLRGLVQVVAGDEHHCALGRNGEAWCWGSNAAGQLGSVSAIPRPVEVRVVAGARSIAVAGNVSCAAVGRGVECWGENERDSIFPPTILPRRWEPRVHARALGFDGASNCAYDRDRVQCQMRQGVRQLVRRDGEPLRLSRGIVFGPLVAAAVVDDGQVAWWRTAPRPADVAATPSQRPVAIVRDVTGILELAMDGTHWYALRKDGSVLHQHCSSTEGCAPSSALARCPLSGLSGIVDLATNDGHACAVRNDGRVACWGRAFSSPRDVPLRCTKGFPDTVGHAMWLQGVTGATRVAVGKSHACAIVEDGRVACWGDNDWGQLGNGDFDTRDRATIVLGLRGAVEIALGDRHSCARLENAEVMCWGDVRYGQMGDGVKLVRSGPVRVAGFPEAPHFEVW
jgi:alpha-tubulin suppressor-like RCC1 family protein